LGLPIADEPQGRYDGHHSAEWSQPLWKLTRGGAHGSMPRPDFRLFWSGSWPKAIGPPNPIIRGVSLDSLGDRSDRVGGPPSWTKSKGAPTINGQKIGTYGFRSCLVEVSLGPPTCVRARPQTFRDGTKARRPLRPSTS
jgi:hypothetical protein